MDDQTRPVKVSPEIYVYATNKNFLNIYDALRIDKVKIEVAGYDQATGRQTGIASAWLDAEDLRLLAHLVTTRQFKDVLDRGRFERFGGSDRDGMVESRTLVLDWDPGEGGRFARYPYRLTITNCPGLRTANGAVQPKGEPATKLSLRLPEADLMKIMLVTYDYLRAYDAAHHHRLVAQKVREVQDKLAGRAERRVPVAAAADEEPEAEPRPARPTPAPLHVVPPAGGPRAASPRPAPNPPAGPVAAAGPAPAARPVAQARAEPPGRAAPPTGRPTRPTRVG